jgi:amino-acid N-acetyltransferase
MTFTIRLAEAIDQPTIEAMVHTASINPRNLHWQRFMVAEQDGRIVGIGQVREYSKGTREVASGVVLPEYQGQGISIAILNALIAQETVPLYMLCHIRWSTKYAPFGFARVPGLTLPADLRREYALGRLITTLMSVRRREHIRIVPLMRPAPILAAESEKAY